MQSIKTTSIASLIGIDRDVRYALASRFTSAGGQLVTLGLISFLMSPAAQGYHFTFLSFIAIQGVFELGFYVVIVNTAAHEWAHLSLNADGIVGGPSRARTRLADLLRFSARWYAFVSLLFVALALPIGGLFFSAQPEVGISWRSPWMMLVLGAGLQIWANGILSFLEGCNQVAEAYRIRVIAALVGQIIGWTVLAAGGGLWIGPVMIGSTALIQILLAWHRRAPLFRSLMKLEYGHTISWRSEIWPLQWRLAVQGLSGFFFFSLFTPMAFHYYGAAVAGRVGLSWTIANGLYSILSAWPQSRAPRLAVLVAQAKHDDVARLFHRTLLFSTSALFLCLVLAWSMLTVLYAMGTTISQRFLPPAPLAYFFAAALLLLLSANISIYFRAHKQDPSTFLNLVTGVMIGLVVWAAGSLAGPSAMAAGFLLVLVLLLLPCQTALFLRYRRQWHPTSTLSN